MNQFLLLTLVLWFGTLSQVNSAGFFDLKKWIFRASSPASEVFYHRPLVLAVENSKRIYLANNEFVLKNQMNNIYEKFLFACPSDPGTRNESMNMIISKTKKLLFIRESDENPVSSKKLDLIKYKCNRPVMASIVHVGPYEGDSEIDLYLVGYEIFMDVHYDSYEIEFFRSANLGRLFSWFNLYTIAFDRKRGNVVNVFSPKLAYNYSPDFETNLAADASKVARAAHTLYHYGQKMFYEETMDIGKLYGKKYQEEMFREQFGDSAPLKYADETQGRYLGAIHLAPPETFSVPLLKQAVDTLGNMAPMWNIVYSKAWMKLNTHIEYLAKGLKAIHVITGTYGTLKLYSKEIYIAPDNYMKVPAAFYKIVSYSPYNKKKYNMLIVTSNNPYDRRDRVNELICEQNQCKEFGWEYVQQDFFAMGRTTCCQLTEENLRKLKLGHMGQLIDETLNLNEVPHWKEDELTLNLKKYILDQIEGVDQPVDSSSYRNELMLIGEEDDEVIFSKFISVLYTNYVQPYFTEKKG